MLPDKAFINSFIHSPVLLNNSSIINASPDNNFTPAQLTNDSKLKPRPRPKYTPKLAPQTQSHLPCPPPCHSHNRQNMYLALPPLSPCPTPISPSSKTKHLPESTSPLLGPLSRWRRKPTSSNHKSRRTICIHAIGQMRRKAALARADDVFRVADGVDFGGRDGAHGLQVVWVAEKHDCGGKEEGRGVS